jgi:hypothetical protein
VGDALERLREMPAGQARACITSPPSNADPVQGATAGVAILHGFAGAGCSGTGTAVSASDGYTFDLAALLQGVEGEAVLRLLLLDQQVRQQQLERLCSFLMSHLPSVKWSPSLGGRLRCEAIAAKGGMQKIYGLRRYLLDRYSFGVVRLCASCVGAFANEDRPIGIDHASQISESHFTHAAEATL